MDKMEETAPSPSPSPSSAIIETPPVAAVAEDEPFQIASESKFDSTEEMVIDNQIEEVKDKIEEPIEDPPTATIPENAAEILEINSTSLTPVQQAVIRTLQASRNPTTTPAAPKQVAIAPKPVSIKKITLSKNAVPIEISRRQMVVMKPAPGQVVCSPGKVLQIRQTTNVSPSNKTGIAQDGNSANVQKTPRYISLQQAKQMGLVTGGKINQLLTLSPVKQAPNTSPTIRPAIRQIVPNIKSPTKILPAGTQSPTTTGKVIIAPNSSMLHNIVIKPTNSRPSHVIKLEGITGANNAILTNISPGQKINPQQLHQLNVPGKGLQLVRFVPPSGQIQKQKLGQTSPVRIAPIPTTTARVLQTSAKLVHTKSPQVHPSLAKALMFDMHGNLVQISASSKVSSISTSSVSTTASNSTAPVATTSAIKKVYSKPLTTKCLPVTMNMTSSIQKISSSSTMPSFTITSIPSSQSSTPDSKIMIFKINDEMQVQKKEAVDDEVMETGDFSDQFIEKNLSAIKAPTSPDLSISPNNADTKHLMLVPPHLIQQIQNANQTGSKLVSIGSNAEMKQGDGRNIDCSVEFGMRPRKPCNCTKSQCLKLYCDCFANGEFCNQCNCNNCFNNLENEEYRQKAIRTCLDRNPNAFRPKIGKAKNYGLEVIRRHNKGCNCKRSGCLKNYCECYEGKIACSANCKCVGCRNIEDCFDKKSLRKAKAEVVMKRLGVKNEDMNNYRDILSDNENSFSKSHFSSSPIKRPSTYITNDLIDAICACLLAQASDAEALEGPNSPAASRHVLEEFSRCLQELVKSTQKFPSSSIPEDARGASS